MISLYDSKITDIAPSNFKKSAEVMALSYAVQRMNQKMIGYARTICIFTALDELQEDIVDLIAVEMRTQYYASDLDIATKRKLVANTLLWYMIAGTPAAVEDLLQIVFGNGEVEEWFDYGGEPGMFKAVTDSKATLTSLEKFKTKINGVKNTRSHLENLVLQDIGTIELNCETTAKYRTKYRMCNDNAYCGTDPLPSLGAGLSQAAVELQNTSDDYGANCQVTGTIPGISTSFNTENMELTQQGDEADSTAVYQFADAGGASK